MTHEKARLIEIPKQFYSDALGRPFDRCVDCDRSLLAPNVHYFIEKTVRNYRTLHTSDTVFEYAICEACYLKVQQTFSEVSRLRLEHFFMDHVSLPARFELLDRPGPPLIETWIDRCLITGTPRDQSDEYQIMAECLGPRLVLGLAPYLVSFEAMDHMLHLLSNQTLDALNGFFDDFIGMPPELRPILKDHPYLLL